MASFSTIETGASGIRAGLQGFERAAQEIASNRLGGGAGEQVVRDSGGSTPPTASSSRPVDGGHVGKDLGGLAEAVVRLEAHARDVQAAAKVVQTADGLLGALLGEQR